MSTPEPPLDPLHHLRRECVPGRLCRKSSQEGGGIHRPPPSQLADQSVIGGGHANGGLLGKLAHARAYHGRHRASTSAVGRYRILPIVRSATSGVASSP